MYRITPYLCAVITAASLPLVVAAQTGSIDPTGEPSKEPTDIPAAPDAPMEEAPAAEQPVAETPQSNPVGTPAAATTASAADGPQGEPAVPAAQISNLLQAPSAAPSAVPIAQATTVPAEAIAETLEAVPISPPSVLLWLVLGFFALLPFGYVVTQLLQSKKQHSETDDTEDGCFNLKKMLDEKLQELTDVRGKIEGKAKAVAKDALYDAIDGTATKEALLLLEKAEREFERVKKLYEKCMIDVEKSTLVGTIVENSLADATFLKKVKVEETMVQDLWTVHRVSLREKQLAELTKQVADGPWYAHFWKPGSDDMWVVFKDISYQVKVSDKATWTDALAHGAALGIPPEQMDFVTD